MVMKYQKQTCVIGLTGGIGAGKSTITNYLETKNIPVFDCDAFVGRLYRNADFVKTLEEKFGQLGDDPKAEMAKRVVANPALMDELAPLFDEMLEAAIKSFISREASCTKNEVVFIDAPVLFEHGMDGLCNVVVTVSVPETIRRHRVMLRPGMTKAKLDMIISKQWTDKQREMKSHFVIHNTGTITETHQRVEEILEAIKRKTDVVA